MQWEQMTSPELGRAAREIGVCVIGMGVLERHSEHLPLGTDYLIAHHIVSLAAEKEPAVAFPPFYFGQIYEARAFPGALTLRPALLMDLVQGVLDEIGRNGFNKIILYNGHGGNTNFIRFLAQCSLWEEKPYTLYAPSGRFGPRAKSAGTPCARPPRMVTPAKARPVCRCRYIHTWYARTRSPPPPAMPSAGPRRWATATPD